MLSFAFNSSSILFRAWATKWMVKGLKARISVDRVTQKINHWLEVANDWVFGISKKRQEKTDMHNTESPYWKQLTGMSKAQFLHAAKKEMDCFSMFSSLSLHKFNPN